MDLNNSKKLIRSKAGLRIVSTNEECRSPFVIKEPNWVPDKEISNCTYCKAKFGFTTRKHHCRRCGLIFCSCCCKSKMGLQRMCFVDPVRICVTCEPETKKENAFFEHQLKLLTNGAVFKYRNSSEENTYHLLHCKLSQDHRYLLFDGVAIAPIDINQIKSLDIKADQSTGLKSLFLGYVIGEEKKGLQLDIAKDPTGKTSVLGGNWFAAIQEAYKLLNRSGEAVS